MMHMCTDMMATCNQHLLALFTKLLLALQRWWTKNMVNELSQPVRLWRVFTGADCVMWWCIGAAGTHAVCDWVGSFVSVYVHISIGAQAIEQAHVWLPSCVGSIRWYATCLGVVNCSGGLHLQSMYWWSSPAPQSPAVVECWDDGRGVLSVADIICSSPAPQTLFFGGVQVLSCPCVSVSVSSSTNYMFHVQVCFLRCVCVCCCDLIAPAPQSRCFRLLWFKCSSSTTSMFQVQSWLVGVCVCVDVMCFRKTLGWCVCVWADVMYCRLFPCVCVCCSCDSLHKRNLCQCWGCWCKCLLLSEH